MARGDTMVSPWTWEAADYVGLAIRITVNFNNSTRSLQSTVVHRDTGCQYKKIVLDVPSDGAKSKRLVAPIDGAGDRTYTANQMKAQGLNTIEDVLAVQITAEP
jgi:hypothetical protein